MNKLWLTVLVVCVAVLGIVSANAETQHYNQAPNQYVCQIRGDLSFDGEVSADDARQILRIVVGLAETDEELNEVADVDMDGKVSAADARLLLRVVVGLERSLSHIRFDKITLEPATCQKNGSSADLCLYCGMLFNYGTIPSPGHVSGGWQTVSAATCRTKGLEEQRCIYCDLPMDSRETTAPHVYGTRHYEIAPSCFDPVNVYRECVNCKYKLYEIEMPTGSHSYVWQVEKPASCLTPGTERKVCGHCGEKTDVTREVAAYGAHALSGWKTAQTVSCATGTEGLLIRTCLRCGETVETQVVEPVHSKIETTYAVLTPASCVREGTATYICAVCRQNVYETLLKTPHTFVGDPETVKPTCIQEGSATYHCEVCGEVKMPIAPLGHLFATDESGEIKWFLDEECGRVYKVCTRCKAKEYGVDVVV